MLHLPFQFEGWQMSWQLTAFHLIFWVNLTFSLTEILVLLEKNRYFLANRSSFACTAHQSFIGKSSQTCLAAIWLWYFCSSCNSGCKQVIWVIWREQEHSCQILTSEGLCFQRQGTLIIVLCLHQVCKKLIDWTTKNKFICPFWGWQNNTN